MQTPEDMVRSNEVNKQADLERQWAADRAFARATEPQLHELARSIKPLLDQIMWQGAQIREVHFEYDGQAEMMAIWEAPRSEPRFLARVGVGSDGRAYEYGEVGTHYDTAESNAYRLFGWILVGAKAMTDARASRLYLTYLERAYHTLREGSIPE